MRAILVGFTWACLVLLGYLIYTDGQLRKQKNVDSRLLGITYTKNLIAENNALIKADIDANRAQIIVNSKNILKKAPLNYNAFIHLAKVNETKTVWQDVMTLNNEALRRNKRSRGALVYGLQQAIRIGDIKNVLQNLDALYHLDRENRKQYISLLVGLFDADDSRPFISKHLESNPAWGYSMFDKLLQTSTADTVFTREAALDTFIPKMENLRLKERLIVWYSNQLISYGHFKSALQFWKRHQDPELLAAQTGKGLVNPTFQKTLLTSPFNWKLRQGNGVLTDLNPQGGLYASFRSEKIMTIGDQYFTWPENHNATVNFDTQYQYKDDHGQFFLQISCLDPKNILAEIVFDETAEKMNQTSRLILAPPNGCALAHMEILARPGIYSQPISITLNFLDVSFTPNTPLSQNGEGE